MFSIKRKRLKPSIATSSMSDIGFLLLIFIMVISLINQRYEEKAAKATEGIYNWQEKKALLDELIKEYLQEVIQ